MAGHLRCGGGDGRGSLGVDLVGLDDGQAQLLRAGGNGRRREHAFAAQRRVRAGQDGNDFMPGGAQGFQGRQRHSWCSGKKYLHEAAPAPKRSPLCGPAWQQFVP